MNTLSTIGRICYGVALCETGIQTIIDHRFPYWLMPPVSLPVFITYAVGIVMALAGLLIMIDRRTTLAAEIAGGLLVIIFVFAFLPYQFAEQRYLNFRGWENAEKELAFAAGALIVTGRRLYKPGIIIYSIPIICFGLIHCIHARLASGYIPAWIPFKLFWMYATGIALIGSGISIILSQHTRLIATLLGAMILTWFLILHIPRIIVSPAPYVGSEITSAMLALAYGGIALVIAANAKQPPR